MTIRSRLRTQIDTAWNKTVSQHYAKQRINSEACLQASFWSHLNEILSAENPNDRRLFVEPSVRIQIQDSDGKMVHERRYSDLVVCSKTQIIAFIELKYIPRGQPSLIRDLEKFIWIAKHRELISIRNERYFGEAIDDNPYKMSKNILYVWCGIYMRLQQKDLRSQLPAGLQNNIYPKHQSSSMFATDEGSSLAQAGRQR